MFIVTNVLHCSSKVASFDCRESLFSTLEKDELRRDAKGLVSPYPRNLHPTTSHLSSKYCLKLTHPSSITPTIMSVQTKATIASFGGKLLKLSHNASSTNCDMAFNLYLPPQTTTNPLRKVPLLIYLAGLTCTGDNGAEKGFFQHAASEKGIALLYPDTSPRMAPTLSSSMRTETMPNRVPGGLNIQGEDDAYDFGSGAGFYVDATKAPWDKGYKMYSYITSELPKTVFDNFKQVDPERVSIFGHSMGGHGALILVGTPSLLFPSPPISPAHERPPIALYRIASLTARPHAHKVPQEPRQIQVRVRLCAHRQPEQVPLGAKGVWRLLRRGGQGELGGARCDGAGEEVVGGAVGYSY